MDRITANEYLNDNSLLQIYYIGVNQKVMLAQTLVQQSLEEINGVEVINYTTLKLLTPAAIFQMLTNIDMVATDENGMSGYDLLMTHNFMTEMPGCLHDQYLEIVELIQCEVKNFENQYNNLVFTIKELLVSLNNLLSNADLQELQNLLAQFQEGERNDN